MSKAVTHLPFWFPKLAQAPVPLLARPAKGLAFGAFDPFHYGHLYMLEYAKSHCDYLTVCVSDDDYIRSVKQREPMLEHSKRSYVIRALRCVDDVDIQSLTFSKADAVARHQPSVIFVGSDWNPDTFTGEGLGVPVVYVPRLPGYSSSALRRQV